MIRKMEGSLSGNGDFEHQLERVSKQHDCCVPQTGIVNGLEVAIGTRPYKILSGDHADRLSTLDGRTVVVLADVSGHGLESATVAIRLHALLHATLKTHMALPDIANILNEYLCEYSPEDVFVTMVCLVIDTKTGEMEYFSAGHPQPLVIDPCGGAEELQDGKNLPLGVLPEPVKCHRAWIRPGTLLALFSDGWSELKCQSGALLGISRLREMLSTTYASHSAASLDEIMEQFEASFRESNEEYFAEDDQTLLFARLV